METKEIRRNNLRELMARYARQGVNQNEFATLVESSAPTLSQIIGEKSSRNLGDNLARRIEARLNLPKGWFDVFHEKQLVRPFDNVAAESDFQPARLKPVVWEDTEPLSFLIDAGAEYNGYAADLTRTYAAQSGSEFAHLVKDLNGEQLALIDTIKPGVRYTDYHVQMHQCIAKLLKNHKLVNGLSEEAMVETGITTPFLPPLHVAGLRQRRTRAVGRHQQLPAQTLAVVQQHFRPLRGADHVHHLLFPVVMQAS